MKQETRVCLRSLPAAEGEHAEYGALKGGERLDQPIIVAGTFADLERAVREVCWQIDLLGRHIPEEEDRAYAELAKQDLWRMYQSAYQRALAREGFV